MMDKINRQFDILTTQTKRFQKLSETYTVESSLFSALLGGIRSVAMISSNISTSFIEILSLDQIKFLFKNNYSLINQITNRMSQLNTKIQQMKKQKQSMKTKANNQNCTICGENIHQSNIKQAKIYLEEQSRQKFQLAMEQFKKIADTPIHTKEQNNQFQQKLHYQLSQRERVLNINCNRIGEYVEVMEGALADLMKLKEIELNQNQIPNVQFINMNKINEDVSNMLQNSFLKKIPPWIHKMFLKMVASYVQECNKRKQEKSIQTIPNDSVSSKQMREYVKQKRQIQKQNKELSDQLKQLKLCYKKLQEINNQYSLTIASMSRNIKHRTQTYKQQKSKRSSKHTVKGQKDKQQSRIDSLSNNAQNLDDDYDMYDEVNFTKKKRNRLFPQIKNKYEGNVTKKGIQLRRQNSVEKNSHGRLTQRSKDATSRKKIADETESNERQLYKKEDSTDRKRNERRLDKQRIQLIGGESVQKQEKGKKREKRNQENNQNGRKSKQIQYNIQNGNPKKLYSNNTAKILTKNNKMNGVIASKTKESDGREKSNYTSNLSNNRRHQDNNRRSNRSDDAKQIEKQIQNDEINQKMNQQLETYQNNGTIGGLSNYNKKNNQKQLMFVKKISENLSNKISIKKNSLYGSVEITDQNQNSLIVLNKSLKNIGLYQSKNTEVIKSKQVSKYQNRYEDINKENLKEYIKICKENKKSDSENQPQERNSEINESKQIRKSFNHQNEYKQKSMKEKSLKNSKVSAANNISQSKDAQKKIFQLLKSNQILQKSVNYKQFVAIISNLSPSPLNEEENTLCEQTSIMKQSSERKSWQVEQGNQENLEQAHNSIYGRLFINKVVAYKYEQSMAKSYHKRVLKQLNELQRDYCYEMYSNLCEAKKIGKETYHQFCSILRYPYQTLYNNFEVVNFMTDMSFDTFQYFFRKIIWIHRKCVKAPNQEVCQHIGSVSEQLKEILKLKS